MGDGDGTHRATVTSTTTALPILPSANAAPSRLLQVDYYYTCRFAPANPTHTCVIHTYTVPSNHCRTVFHEAPRFPAPHERSTHDQRIAAELRKLEARRQAGDLAIQTQTISHQAVVIDQQAHAIESLRHDAALAEVALFALICVVIALLSVLFNHRAERQRPAAPSTEDIIGAVLRSTSKRL